MLLSTHIVSDVEYIADKVLLMKGGALIMCGAPESVVASVAGKVWECRASAQKAARMAEELCASNVHYASDQGGRRSCYIDSAHRRGSFRRADAGRFVSLHVQGR